MENVENLSKKQELLANLEQTKEIIKRNLQANSKLNSLQKELAKNNTEVWYTLLGVIIGISALVVSSTSLQKLKNYEPIFILIPIGLVVLSIVLFRRLGKVKEKSLIRKRFETRKNEIDEINSIILATFEEVENISVLPEKYRNIQSIEKIQEYITNKRADSLKEALNLYEDEKMKSQQTRALNRISQQQTALIQIQQATNRQLIWQTLIIAKK